MSPIPVSDLWMGGQPTGLVERRVRHLLKLSVGGLALPGLVPQICARAAQPIDVIDLFCGYLLGVLLPGVRNLWVGPGHLWELGRLLYRVEIYSFLPVSL